MSVPPAPRTAVDDAVWMLTDYLQGALSLDELIEWAEQTQQELSDEWLHRVTADLANPLLCREQATALALEHLRLRTALDG
jgi:hypothetical protein